jgi:uncharacterized caspase-like protein
MSGSGLMDRVEANSSLPDLLSRRLWLKACGCLAAAATTGAWPRLGHGAATRGEGRLALIIGNARYTTAPLKNTINDARLIGGAASRLGFRVAKMEDAGRDAMIDGIRDFVSSSGSAAVRMLYFAGHGAQYRGRNFLIPVDADLDSEDDLPAQAIDAVDLADRIARMNTGVSLMVLDACRSAPFRAPPGPQTRGVPRPRGGLAGLDAPRGTIVAYATAPGRTATDDGDVDSPYARHLAEELVVPGLSIETVFKRVRLAVMRDTDDRQVPWESSSLVGEFCLTPDANGGCGTRISRPSPVVDLNGLK